MDCQDELFQLRMGRLGFPDPAEKERYEEKKVEINQKISRIRSEARNNAKSGKCFICGKECSSYCKSHSIPHFALQNVATNGKVYATLQGEVPTLGKDTGIASAGTFFLICEACDNERFQEYEAPGAYGVRPTDRMLAQIAMKNHLQMISKRKEERELYRILCREYPENSGESEERIAIGDYDLKEYLDGFKCAKKALDDKTGSQHYYLCYFRVLDYVVPYAAQSSIAMICDFEDNVINDIFNRDEKYTVKNIHVAIFPLETKSVVMLFIEDGEKRYRKFYKQLSKLDPDDQLAAINYLVFSYAENVFLNVETAKKMQFNQMFMDTCRKSVDAVSFFPVAFEPPLNVAVREFSMGHRNEIPNLLSKDYALDIT